MGGSHGGETAALHPAPPSSSCPRSPYFVFLVFVFCTFFVFLVFVFCIFGICIVYLIFIFFIVGIYTLHFCIFCMLAYIFYESIWP